MSEGEREGGSLWVRWSAWDEEFSCQATGWLEGPFARGLAWFLAHSGDSQWWLLVGMLFWWRGEGGWRTAGMRIVLTTLTAGLISFIFKRLIRRPRPEGQAGLFYLPFDRHSFPSGHATRVASLVLTLGSLAPAAGAAALGVWAFLVGASRVTLGVHYAGDIVAGWVLGALVGGVLVLAC